MIIITQRLLLLFSLPFLPFRRGGPAAVTWALPRKADAIDVESKAHPQDGGFRNRLFK